MFFTMQVVRPLHKITRLILVFLLAMIPAFGCTPPPHLHKIQIEKNHDKTFYIVRHKWHTGIVIKISEIPHKLLPEKNHFPKAKYIEIGWGDAAFYRAKHVNFELISNALLFPTKSVVHIVGFENPVEVYFDNVQIFKIESNQKNYRKMVSFIGQSLSREANQIAKPIGPGRYGSSNFYNGVGNYHLFRTCNNWTAEALLNAGIPISNMMGGTAGGVSSQLSYYSHRTPNLQNDGLVKP